MQDLTKGDLHFIVSRLPVDIRKLLREYPALKVAGGFIRSTIAGEKISDIDIFADSVEVLEDCAKDIALDRKGKLHVTKNAITVLAPPRIPLQFITRWTFTTSELLIASFDFTIAQALVGFDAESNKWYGRCGDRFYPDLAARRLYYTSPKREEEVGGSLMRVRKFIAKGYNIQSYSLGMIVARLYTAVEAEKLQGASEREIGQVLVGLLQEVDPLIIIDGIDLVDEHEIIDENPTP